MNGFLWTAVGFAALAGGLSAWLFTRPTNDGNYGPLAGPGLPIVVFSAIAVVLAVVGFIVKAF
jgi:hypothetical protein